MMTGFARVLLAAALMAIPAIAQVAPANAQVPPARALFLDLETVFQQSIVGKDIRGQLESMLAEIAQREQTAIQSFEARQVPGMSEEAYRQLQAEKLGQRDLFQLERASVQTAAAAARRQVNAELNKIMQEVLVERGANMILSVDSVLVGGVDYDVTAEVIARLDRRMTKLKVERPK